jgi:hypothetical protein
MEISSESFSILNSIELLRVSKSVYCNNLKLFICSAIRGWDRNAAVSLKFLKIFDEDSSDKSFADCGCG